MTFPRRILFAALILALFGVFSAAPAAFAQDACPLPAGVTANPLATPSVTAAQVEAGAASISDFALAAKGYMESVNLAGLSHNACVIRQEGPWKSGDTYLVTISIDGRVFFHSDEAELSGRPLNNRVYGAILRALGITATAPADISAALANVATTGSFPNANGGQIPVIGGYAVGFKRTGGNPLILVAGLDIGESHLGTETIDQGSPDVRADQVMDRDSLKAFVEGATQYVVDRFRTEGRSAFTQVKSVLRDPSGPWRSGPTYLFIMDPSGYTIFHGAFPDRFEFRTPTNTLREQLPSGEQGDLILPKIIRTAISNPGGGFVEYYFDNPDDPNDDFNTLKVSYVRQHVFEGQRADGTTFEYPLIFGAGIYGDSSTVAEDVCPRPAGLAENMYESPSVTAGDVASSSGDVGDFAQAGRNYFNSITTPQELAYAGCLIRNEGPWKAGDTYIVALSLDGRVILNGKDMSTGGRPLQDAVYGAILGALGITATTEAGIRAALANVATTGSFPNANGGQIPGIGGYAVGYGTTIPYILLAGVDLQEAHFKADIADPGDPDVSADQVVDRATLKRFVNGAIDHLLEIFDENPHSAIGIARSILRNPPWRSGPTYLFVMEDSGYTLLHAGFPDRYEFQTPTQILRDEVTGKLILPQIIEAANAGGDEGAFVRYYFDDPSDHSDSADVPKVTYARRLTFSVPGSPPVSYIVGAGIYGDPSTVAEEVCPRPAGLAENMYESPSVTADDVASGSGDVGDFAQAGRDYFDSIRTPGELGYAGCIARNEGPWKSGSTYLVSVSLDGRVFFNGNDMSTGGRPLNPLVYGGILQALGIPVDPANPKATEDALTQVATRAFTTGQTTFPKANGGALPGGGYAVGYGTRIPYILLAGVDLQEAHFGVDTVDPGDPEVSADQVVDRATLKRFVNGAVDHLLEIFNENPTGAIGIARSILRRPPWRHGPVYLFVIDPTGYTHLHGGFPDRFEFQTPTQILRDEVTGELILPQIIEVAQQSGDKGGFVRYFFDNPDDDTDSADVPKVTYARLLTTTIEIPGFPPQTNSFIVGAGIYGDEGAVSEKSVAATSGWLARFGRAVGSQAVDMISSRLNAPAPSGAKMTLGGQTVKLDADPERYLTKEGAGFDFASHTHNGIGTRGLARARTANRLTNGEEDSTGSYREMTMSGLLSGASFHLASTREAAEAAGSRWSIWARGAQSSFEGGGDDAIEGDVTTAMLGVDYEKGKLLAGVALSRSSGDGGFQNDGRSELEASLTSVHPYLRYEASERLSLWGILGMGQGEMTLDETDSESGQEYETDIEMRMGAFGVRGELTRLGGFDLAVKSDVLLTQMDADAKDGLEAISAESSRLRVLLEASREVAMEGGGTVRPSVEAGLRLDGGDVDEGLGVEVGGSLRFTNPGMGLTLEVNARGLITHEESDVADWGVGGMIRIAPGKAGRGLALTVQPLVGETAGGAERLWGLKDASRLAREEIEDLDPRVRAEVGYRLDAWGGLLTPYAGLSVSDSGNGTYRLGGRFKVGELLSMSLEGDVRERVNADPVHGVALRGSLRW